jgi:hypothetical protein
MQITNAAINAQNVVQGITAETVNLTFGKSKPQGRSIQPELTF